MTEAHPAGGSREAAPVTEEAAMGSDSAGISNRERNLSKTERVVSAAAGGAMVWAGVRMRSLPGFLIALAGGLAIRRGMSGHCPMYQALGIQHAQGDGAPGQAYFHHGLHVVQSVTINKTPEELYRFWQNFENLPRFMRHLERVEKVDGRRWRWKASAPAGASVQWEAEVINDVPNELIAWRSLYPADVDNAGSVRFLPAGSGATHVVVTLDYIPPAGKVGWAVAKVFGKDASTEVRQDLELLKKIVEAGDPFAKA